jgi:hypothetical protein
MSMLFRGSLGARAFRAGTLATLAIGLTLILAASPASATIYKWIDRNGNVGFTDDLSKVPAAYRDQATSMSEKELQERVPIRKDTTPALAPIRVPARTPERASGDVIIRAYPSRFEPPAHLRWSERSTRQVYVPDLGFLAEDSPIGPSEWTGHERFVYLDGKRFFLKNPYPVQGDMNWADKETLQRVFGPGVRSPELDVYLGGQP